MPKVILILVSALVLATPSIIKAQTQKLRLGRSSLCSAMRMKPALLWEHQADGTPIAPQLPGAENRKIDASCGTIHVSIEDDAKYACWHLSIDAISKNDQHQLPRSQHEFHWRLRDSANPR